MLDEMHTAELVMLCVAC